MTTNHLAFVSRWGGSLLLVAALAACSSSKPLTETGHDAAGVGSAGASGTESRGSSGGDAGRGGSSNAGGASAGEVTGSAGRSGSGGALAGSTVPGGSSGGTSGPAGNKAPDAGAGSGGSSVLGGSGGKESDVSGRDAAVSLDASLERPRSDSSSPDRGSPDARTDALSAAAQEYVTAYAAPYCSRLAACCAQNGFPTPQRAACEAGELGYVKSLDDGSAVIDRTVIQTILTQLQDSCDQPSYAVLARTTKGTRAAGEPCDSVDQCESEPGICLNKKCMVPPRGKAGDGCAVTCDDYTSCKWTTSGGKSPYAFCDESDGLRCDRESQTCVALKAAGETCADFTECGTHADCSSGICVARVKLGADCSRTSCDRGLQCGNGTGSAYVCQKASIAWSGSCSP